MSFFTCNLSSRQAAPSRMRAVMAASIAALTLTVAPAQAATIAKVFDFAFAGSFINNGYPQLAGSVTVTFDEGLNYTGPGSATANGEITVDALQLYRLSSPSGPVQLISDQASDVLRIQYVANNGAISSLFLSSWVSTAGSGDFQIAFRAPNDILTQAIQTNTFFSGFQICTGSNVTVYVPFFEACHGGSVTVSDFVPAVVPIPAALPLLASGLLGLVGIRRLSRRAV